MSVNYIKPEPITLNEDPAPIVGKKYSEHDVVFSDLSKPITKAAGRQNYSEKTITINTSPNRAMRRKKSR